MAIPIPNAGSPFPNREKVRLLITVTNNGGKRIKTKIYRSSSSLLIMSNCCIAGLEFWDERFHNILKD